MRKYFPCIVCILMILIDQFSKIYVRQIMSIGESIPVIGNIFHITYIENDGVAFGLLAGHPKIFVGLGLVILLGLIYFAWKEHSHSLFLSYGVALIFAGAMGNIIDRAQKASVTDMFDFRIWPIFNVADIAVCVGFFLLVIYLLFHAGETDGK